ncbi:calcium-binding protein [Nocardioides litoris]|uniref:calcium-binding protein n=1 Tax=Nocardioides litoris TaxID=1926648 RepID=UPI00111FFF2A|nr:calcium-binding protein [Nocardioides litoris]
MPARSARPDRRARLSPPVAVALGLAATLLAVVPAGGASAAPPALASATASLLASPEVAVPASPAPAARRDRRRGHPVLQLVGQFPTPYVRPRQARLEVSRFGLRFWGGKGPNRLTITEVAPGVLRYADTAARSWRGLPGACRRTPAARGVAATCRVPQRFRAGRMFLEVFPRFGDDVVDTRTLPARYRSWALTDEGRDRISTGAGNDFVNGAFRDDVISLGAGNDWTRAGLGTNRVDGGPGNDRLAGGDERDVLRGGPGDDIVSGGPGNDALHGDAGADRLQGGPGRDAAYRDASDRVFECEVVSAA